VLQLAVMLLQLKVSVPTMGVVCMLRSIPSVLPHGHVHAMACIHCFS
jgi:hypothetical protein